jgi:large subunit ribosomal protein L19
MAIKIDFKGNAIGVGDKVKISQKVQESGKDRHQIFIGTIIKIKGNSENRTITVRRIGANLIGIEKIFSINNPSIEEIIVTRIGVEGARRSKLYYIRRKAKKEIDKIYSRSTRRILPPKKSSN